MTFQFILVGKPNVGKSTLFNLLSSKKLSITHDFKGVTIDLKESIVNLGDLNFKVIDSGGLQASYVSKTTNEIYKKIHEFNLLAIKKADLVGFIIESKDGITSLDQDLAELVRKNNPNIILIINKVDNKKSYDTINQSNYFGFKNIVEISATHKIGMSDLTNAITPYYNEYHKSVSKDLAKEDDQTLPPDISIGIIGKPNVGKSTLINKILNQERLITSSIAGTTRDSISVYFNHNDKLLRLIDTAGLRRRSRVNHILEKLSTQESIRTIIFSQVVILIVSAEEGITKQDLLIISHIIKEGRAFFILVNKIDLVVNPKIFLKEIKAMLTGSFSDVKNIEVLTTSALMQTNINLILNTVFKVYERWNLTIKTSFLNKWLATVLAKNPPPLNGGKTIKIKFMNQSKSRPPTFNLWISSKLGLPDSYMKYIKNQLYHGFNLKGIPIRLITKLPTNPYNY